jgi:mannosyltransferase OCH1-like enzyme
MIEKNLFQSWCTRELHPLAQQEIDRIKALNPEYNYQLYTDDEIDRFVDEYYPGEIAECYHRLNIIVAKVDFWRYLVLYKYGGVYLDMDSTIKKPLRMLIKDTDEAIITVEKNPNRYVQWGLIFSKGHPILKRTIDLVVENIKYNLFPNNIVMMTGPAVYSRAINEIHMELFDGKMLIHRDININTDITYRANNVSYRIYNVDYGEYFKFEHETCNYLYINKKHWSEEEKEKPLLL